MEPPTAWSLLDDDAVCEVARRSITLLVSLASTCKELRRVLHCWLRAQVSLELEESTPAVAELLACLAAAPHSRLQHIGLQGRGFPVQELRAQPDLDFVTGLGARDSAEDLDTEQAILLAPMLRRNRLLSTARATLKAGVIDLKRVCEDAIVDLRGRNLCDADALVIAAKLQQPAVDDGEGGGATDEGEASRDVLAHTPREKRLWLSGNNLGDAACLALAATFCPPPRLGTFGSGSAPHLRATKLACLGLPKNQIGDRGIAALARLLSSGHEMKELHLWGNRIGDAGCSALARALPMQATLHTLTLQDNVIGDLGIGALASVLTDGGALELEKLRVHVCDLPIFALRPPSGAGGAGGAGAGAGAGAGGAGAPAGVPTGTRPRPAGSGVARTASAGARRRARLMTAAVMATEAPRAGDDAAPAPRLRSPHLTEHDQLIIAAASSDKRWSYGMQAQDVRLEATDVRCALCSEQRIQL